MIKINISTMDQGWSREKLVKSRYIVTRKLGVQGLSPVYGHSSLEKYRKTFLFKKRKEEIEHTNLDGSGYTPSIGILRNVCFEDDDGRS